MKLGVFCLVVGIVAFFVAISLPAATIEHPDIKINLAVFGMFTIFMSLAGIIGGGK